MGVGLSTLAEIGLTMATGEATRGRFKVVSEYRPAGDQPKAIAELSEGIEKGDRKSVV